MFLEAPNVIIEVLDAETAPSGITESNNQPNTDPKPMTVPSCTVDDASVLDPHLQVGSPAIDTGLTLPAITNDYYGTSRPQGAGYDIGQSSLFHEQLCPDDSLRIV